MGKSGHVRYRHTDAGWSSSVARRAHNPEVAGSNPVPATKMKGPASAGPLASLAYRHERGVLDGVAVPSWSAPLVIFGPPSPSSADPCISTAGPRLRCVRTSASVGHRSGIYALWGLRSYPSS